MFAFLPIAPWSVAARDKKESAPIDLTPSLLVFVNSDETPQSFLIQTEELQASLWQLATCPWQGDWNSMIFKVHSNQSNPIIRLSAVLFKTDVCQHCDFFVFVIAIILFCSLFLKRRSVTKKVLACNLWDTVPTCFSCLNVML